MAGQVDNVCPDGPSCPDPDCQANRRAQGLIEGESLYRAVVRLGIPYASHYSDLYLPATQQVRELLKAHGITPGGWSAPSFTNQVEGGIWYDVAFKFDPYWEAKQKR
jgi:hypothetical protein